MLIILSKTVYDYMSKLGFIKLILATHFEINYFLMLLLAL